MVQVHLTLFKINIYLESRKYFLVFKSITPIWRIKKFYQWFYSIVIWISFTRLFTKNSEKKIKFIKIDLFSW